MQPEIHSQLLKLLEENPLFTQRELAKSLGISLGRANYRLKALKDKGWVKWGNFSSNPNKLRYMYLITPQGLAQKLMLIMHFLKHKQEEYESLKKRSIACKRISC